MASILDKYGIKEVADVVFYDISDNKPVLYLDTLKVSTIEQTAEQSSARGGKGNPELITWDYNKEITVSLEDALFSAKSMAIMFGDGTVSTNASASIMKTIEFKAASSSINKTTITYAIPGGATQSISSSAEVSVYNPDGTLASTVSSTSTAITGLTSGERYLATFAIPNVATKTITITANTFPGTYKVVGDTYARAYEDGKDQFFQFVIHKAKVTPEQTITLEAEGDPSTFNLNLKVLRPDSGPMMELISYDYNYAS